MLFRSSGPSSATPSTKSSSSSTTKKSTKSSPNTSSSSSSDPVKKLKTPAVTTSVPNNNQRKKHAYYANQQNAQRKRQRRQTAGALVSGLLSGGKEAGVIPKGKKSTAQPRPAVTVPPRGIGPIYEPNDNDVLSGRGGRINSHVGNVRFRELVVKRKKDYLNPATKKLEKAHIAAELVREIRNRTPPGRFLKEDADGAWYDIGDTKAIKKVGQALREDASEVRNEFNSDDEKEKKPVKAISGAAAKQPATKRPSKKVSSGASVAEGSITVDPLAFGPPTSIVPPQWRSQFAGGGTTNKTSGAAAALLQEDTSPMMIDSDTAFGKTFHAPQGINDKAESAISGLTNTILSGTSGISALTDPISSLSGMAPPTKRPMTASQFHAMRANQLQQLRHKWETTNNNRTFQGSDMAGQAVMPATQQQQQQQPQGFGQAYPVQRSLSWHDGASVDAMSLADHSLVGGGIPDGVSVLSAHSFRSNALHQQWQQQQQHQHHQQPSDNDSMAFVEQLMMGNSSGMSVASRRSAGAFSHQRGMMPPPAPVGLSSGQSIANMSFQSIGSVNSIMSDLSQNLLALDLAESSKLLDQL